MIFRESRSILSILFFCWTTICHFSNGTATQQTSDLNINDSNLGSSFFFYQQSTYPRDCKEVQEQCSSRNSTGVFMIKPDGYVDPFEVYCDSPSDVGGWTVIQRRTDGSINFNRDWESYKSGFGFLSGEFWLGNEKLAFLTNQKKYQLVVEMTTINSTLIKLVYDSFRLSDSFSEYAITTLGDYSGTTDAITFCPSNMVFKNCANSCQRACGTPNRCQEVSCTVAEECVCPDGFFMKGSDCVPREQCGCYESEGDTIIPEGDFYVNPGCTRKGVCTNGRIDWNEGYVCSNNAVCDVRNNRRQCYCTGGYRGDGETCTRPPKDCQEIYEDGSTSNGVYRIKPRDWAGQAFEVYCNMSDGGGWTVFQRRVDGTQDFDLSWNEYKEGFGDLNHELWMGNDKLYYLTTQKRYEIRIDLVNRYGAPYYAKFDYFRINDESDNYRLSGVGSYSGTADTRSSPDGRQLRYSLNWQFSTKDRDNDGSSGHCAASSAGRGPFWHNGCAYAHLNAPYGTSGFEWSPLPGARAYLRYCEMKVRPI